MFSCFWSRRSSRQLLAGVAAIALASTSSVPTPLTLARAQTLSDAQLEQVKARLAEGATHSWELGTRAQALLEAGTPSYSVLTANASVPPASGEGPSSLSDVLAIAKSAVGNLTNISSGAQPLMDVSGGAAGDPPSIGVAVLLANWTGRGAADGLDYAGAAEDQLEFLLEKVPQTSDGAISHRTEQTQLWSDFVYMVPPFLAYYGVLSQNQTLLQAAYDQCKLYRQYLVDDDAGGMWKHIVLGSSGTDSGHWTTGNGWAAAGMLRVLGTIQRSQYASRMKNQQKDLVSWISGIHAGVYPHLTNGLFKNYADNNATFDDASGTAILASSVYRLAVMAGVHTHLPDAEKSRKALSAPSNTTSSSSSASASTTSTSASASASAASSLAHFTSDMWLEPVVNPNEFGVQGEHSPEGQAFVVEMYAAWADWTAAGSPGANGAARLRVQPAAVLAAALGVAGAWITV